MPDQPLMATTHEQASDPAFNDILVVPLENVLALADPRAGDPWDIGEFTDLDVLEQMLHPATCQCLEPPEGGYGCRACNLERIAVFVRGGINPDDPRPISLDVGFGSYVPAWPLDDGNHRVAAAAVRGDELVVVEVAGDWDRAVALLVDGKSLSDVLEAEAVDCSLGEFTLLG